MRILAILLLFVASSSIYAYQEITGILKPSDYALEGPEPFPAQKYKISILSVGSLKSTNSQPIDVKKHDVLLTQIELSLISFNSKTNQFLYKVDLARKFIAVSDGPFKSEPIERNAIISIPNYKNNFELSGNFTYTSNKIVIKTDPNSYFDLTSDKNDIILSIKNDVPLTIRVDD